MGRDPNIYGSDDTDFAASVSADALTPTQMQAEAIDQDARSQGNSPEREDNPVRILKGNRAGGGDTESMNASTKGGQRHRSGPGVK